MVCLFFNQNHKFFFHIYIIVLKYHSALNIDKQTLKIGGKHGRQWNHNHAVSNPRQVQTAYYYPTLFFFLRILLKVQL